MPILPYVYESPRDANQPTNVNCWKKIVDANTVEGRINKETVLYFKKKGITKAYAHHINGENWCRPSCSFNWQIQFPVGLVLFPSSCHFCCCFSVAIIFSYSVWYLRPQNRRGNNYDWQLACSGNVLYAITTTNNELRNKATATRSTLFLCLRIVIIIIIYYVTSMSRVSLLDEL